VSGCRFPIQQAGFGQHECSSAYACNVRPQEITLFEPINRLFVVLDAFLEFFAQQTFGTDEQDENNDDEGQGVLEGDGYESAGETFGHSENEASHDGAGQAVQPTEDGGGETFQERFQHEKRVQEQGRGQEKPCKNAEEGGQSPAEGENFSRGDPQGLGTGQVLGCGPHGKPYARLLNEEVEEETGKEADTHGAQAQLADHDASETVDLGVRQGKGKGLGFGTAEIGDEPLEDQTESKGQDNLPQLRGLAALGRDEDTEIEEHGDGGPGEEGQEKGQGKMEIHAQEHESNEGPCRGYVSVGKVEDAGRAIDQCEPEGDQGVDAAG